MTTCIQNKALCRRSYDKYGGSKGDKSSVDYRSRATRREGACYNKASWAEDRPCFPSKLSIQVAVAKKFQYGETHAEARRLNL